MTTYYIDSDNGSDGNDGLGTGGGNAWATIHKFTENARSAGDIAICRRGATARYDDGGYLEFTTDGTAAAPLTIEADYDDAWGDDTATSGETYTLTHGSKTVTGSAAIDASIVAGAWVYVVGDDQRVHAYEVESTATPNFTLFLPFKGADGSGKSLIVMKSAPVWGATTSHAFSALLSQDNYWRIQGLSLASSATGSLFAVSLAGWSQFKDCILLGSTSTAIFIAGDNTPEITFVKCRALGYESVCQSGRSVQIVFEECLFDGNSGAASFDASNGQAGTFFFTECELKGHTSADFLGTAHPRGHLRFLRNCILGSSTEVSGVITPNADALIISEDHDGVVGDTKQFGNQAVADNTPFISSDTSVVRTDGGNISLLIKPGLRIGTYANTRIKIFEYPIYTDTTSKTYTVFFKSHTIAEWTTGPTATELYLEMDAWGHASNNFRKKTQSTGTVDFTTDTDFDQSISVTVAPAQAGVAYLRLYYAKPKESGKDNFFYVDTKPIIS